MIRNLCILLFVVLFSTGNVFAQRYRLLDSLVAEAASAPDSLLPKLYHDIAWEYRDVDPILGLHYGLMALEVSDLQDNEYYSIMAYNVLAISERKIGRIAESIDMFRKVEAKALKYGNKELLAFTYANMGNAYMYMDYLDSAEHYQYLALSQLHNDSVLEVNTRIYLNLGLIAKRRGDYETALIDLEKSYIMSRRSHNHLVKKLSPVNEIVNLLIEKNRYQEASNFIYKYLDREGGNLPEGHLSQLWYHLADIYYKLGRLDSAEISGQAALTYAMRVGNVDFVETNCMLLDSIYLGMGNPRKAAICLRNFIEVTDTLFNGELIERLGNIRYSSQYIQNKKTLAASQQDRKERFYFILLGILVLVLVMLGVWRIVSTVRKAHSVHRALDTKRAAVISSIEYASTIQKAVLPDIDKFVTSFEDYFVMFEPRDIVSGDFFWRYSDSRYEMIAVADCTGHGVPGAILTMLGASALQDIAINGERNAGRVLDMLREKVVCMLRLNEYNPMKDGMDMSLIVVDRESRVLDFAGAFNSLIYIRDDEYHSIKATRVPIGYYVNMLPFESQYLDMEPGDVYYLVTDGFTSQFGGDKGGKYPVKRFRSMLVEIHHLPMAEQKEILTREFKEWKGTEDQVDDVTIVGLKY